MNNLDLISRALRRIGVLAAGRLPNDTDAADALQLLSGLYLRMITEGALGTLQDVIPTTDYTAGENERVIRSVDLVGSITLPDTITGCDGTSRPPRDGALVIITDQFTGKTESYIFDGATKLWVLLNELNLTSEAPLGQRDPIGLSCLLAVELADEYGQQPTEMTRFNAARFMMGITHNWSNPQAVVRGVYF